MTVQLEAELAALMSGIQTSQFIQPLVIRPSATATTTAPSCDLPAAHSCLPWDSALLSFIFQRQGANVLKRQPVSCRRFEKGPQHSLIKQLSVLGDAEVEGWV